MDLIEELHLGRSSAIQSIAPLTGGVASDIVKVVIGDRTICLKCALEKLRVSEDWQAPTHRNKAEYAWLQVAARVNPRGALQLLGRSQSEPCFAMEYIEGDDVFLWKARLLAGEVSLEEARRVGSALGRIHSASSSDSFVRDDFANQADFYQLRLDPYLNFTAIRHPQAADRLGSLVSRLEGADKVLIHGDVSPKNIMFRSGVPIFLDAECATMGDASFDVAFCLNHLVLKAIHLPAARSALLDAVQAFWDSYASEVDWESCESLESRTCELLPALMLARVDGKSPVEYLSDANRQVTREISQFQLERQSTRIADIVTSIAHHLENQQQ